MLEIFSSCPVAKGMALKEEATLPCVTVSREERNPAEGGRALLVQALCGLRMVGKVKHGGMFLDGDLLDPFSLICFYVSRWIRNLQACFPVVSFFFPFPSPGGRTVCLPFEGRNNGLSIFSPCCSLVLREACVFPAKTFSFNRYLAQEREVWLNGFGGCLFFLFLCV